MIFASIPDIIEEIKAGKMIVLVDDENRENEGDLVCAAELITPEIINFMATHGRGMICQPMTAELCDKLELPMQVELNTAPLQTGFTVTIDAREGTTTGISATDRARTILQAIKDDCKPSDLVRPGHIFPLKSKNGGVLVRQGQTEGAVDLARMAGLKPSGVICEIMNKNGSMARLKDLEPYCKKHNLKICSVASLIEYRQQTETLVTRVEAIDMPTDCGIFRLFAYQTSFDKKIHLALCKGGIGEYDMSGNVIQQEETILIRVHSECMTGDIFHSQRCDCGAQLHTAMEMIEKNGKGVIIYLRQEGRGIGLKDKLHSYHLQEIGMNTIQANQWLGHAADKRDYGVGAHICRDLGIAKVANMTNNPVKTDKLTVYGITVEEQVPIEINATKHNLQYLKTKRDQMGHVLPNLHKE